MSKETLAQSGTAAAPSNEAEYHAVYAAVTATERGRWFLAEFANRNRKADTDLILAAIARVEVAIHAGAAPEAALQAALPSEAMAAASARVASAAVRGGERDEEIADEAAADKGVTDEGVADLAASTAAPADSGLDAPPQELAQTDKDYSDAVAAIAASLTTRLEESANDPTQEAVEEDRDEAPARPAEPTSILAEIAQPAVEAIARGRVPQDNSPRWHIEAPDFVFGQADSDEAIAGVEPPREPPQLQSQQMQSQLLGAEIMSSEFFPEQIEQTSAADEDPRPRVTAAEAPPAPAATEEAAPVLPSALDIVPLTEVARPQLRIAREAALVNPRPPRFGSLTVTDALSEDEVIALFG